METILDKIIEQKKQRLDVLKQKMPWESLIGQPLSSVDRGLFKAALIRDKRLAIIAEVKQASPSKGIICENYCPEKIAQMYQSAGADCISVLTEEAYFKGSPADLRCVRQAVTVPILRKDFIIDPWQVYESAVLQVDAILLIVAALDALQLQDLYQMASDLGLDCLVEVHNLDEVETAVKIGAEVMGINNRNLHSFEVDLNITPFLRRYLSAGQVVVSESGITDRSDMAFMQQSGVDAVLIGESLLRADSIPRHLKYLRGERSDED